MNAQPLVKVRNIGISFGATRALDQVDFDFYPGEIVALCGANGAGKSTLIKVICGYHTHYEGDIFIGDEQVVLHSPRDAYEAGIQTVHQIINQGVVQNMTVAENLALKEMLSPEQPVMANSARIRERAQEIATRMQLTDLDLDAKVGDLGQSDRQMICIARALAASPKLLILDEPTSSLSENETETLFATLKRLRDEGVCIVYVSHRLHEITRLADRVGVLRDGRLSGELQRPFDVHQIVHSMVGDVRPAEISADGQHIDHDTVRLELQDLVVEPGKAPLNLKLHAGEVLGITGLIGAGKTELAEVLFGIRRPVSGRILVNGEEVKVRTIREAIDHGIFMVPEDRNNKAVIPENSIRHNLTLPFLDDYSRGGIMQPAREQAKAEEMIASLGIKCAGDEAMIESLSGGNQQKVIVGRWLLRSFNVLLMDEPFQGVDVKARRDIAAHIRENIGTSASIVFGTDLDEVIEVADRIVVFNAGKVAGEQLAGHLDRTQLLHWTAEAPDQI